MRRIATATLTLLAAAAMMAGCGSSGPDTTPPNVPVGFARTGGGDGENAFGWTASKEKDLAGYKLYRTEDDPANEFTLIATISPDSISYTDSGLDYTIQFYYCLTAFDESGNESDRTTPTAAIPANLTAPDSPTGTTVLAQNIEKARVTVSWDPNKEGDLLEYRLFRGTAASVSTTGTPYAVIAAGTESYIDTVVTVGIEYFYRVIAVDKGQLKSPGSLSEEVSDILLPAPTLVAPADNATVTSLAPTLSWNAVPGAQGYLVAVYGERSGKLVEKWSKVLSGGGTTSVGYEGETLSPTTTYTWGVSTYTNDPDYYNSESVLWDFTTP